VDPAVEVRPAQGQVADLLDQIARRVEAGERTLITTLTKRLSEDLSEYIRQEGYRCKYLHSEIDTLERVDILRELREGKFDVLVGVNLLREGLDLPEVSLVCILDADKEGFLRNETSLIQTAGRAARHIHGECVLFCDEVTESIQRLLDVTDYRRARQKAHNEEHGITPRSVVRSVQESLHQYHDERRAAEQLNRSIVAEDATVYDAVNVLMELEAEMQEAAAKLEFEKAAHLRDQIREVKRRAGIEARDDAKPSAAKAARAGESG